MIDVLRLRVLRAVAEHGSFNRAAAALLLTPSAVSQHVAALERSLGTRVVERSTRGVTLTQAGHIMVGAAESVAAELTHARRETDRLGTGRTQVTVATFTSGGRLLLPGALARLTAAHPGTVVHVREAEPEEALLLVRQSAERAGCTPEVRGTTTDYFFACSLVAAGLGVSLIPAIALTSVPPGLRVLPVAPPVPARHIGVAMPRGRGDHPYVRTLVGALRDEAAAVRTIVPPCPVI